MLTRRLPGVRFRATWSWLYVRADCDVVMRFLPMLQCRGWFAGRLPTGWQIELPSQAGCGPTGTSRHSQFREVTQRLEARKKKVCAAPNRRECRQAFDRLADRPLRDLELQRAVVVTDDRVSFVTEFVKVAVVHPHVLGKLKLANQARADHERRNSSLNAVFRRTLRQKRAVS